MEQKAGHTPGPWAVESFTDSYEVAVEESLVTIAAVRRFSGRERANARLIAAAPELLEACRWVEQAQRDGDYMTAFRAVSAAIAKAEGGAA